MGLGVVWSVAKTIGGFFSASKYYIIAAAVGTVAIASFAYVSNHELMRASIDFTEQKLVLCEDTNLGLRSGLMDLNQRMISLNTQRMLEIKAANARYKSILRVAQALRDENTQLLDKLQAAQYRQVEAMRDNEEFNDWANEPVPPTTWSLLHDSAEGSRSH